jgi:hypothetical protein
MKLFLKAASLYFLSNAVTFSIKACQTGPETFLLFTFSSILPLPDRPQDIIKAFCVVAFFKGPIFFAAGSNFYCDKPTHALSCTRVDIIIAPKKQPDIVAS